MAQPYVGEIRLFAGNFAPAGWMFCAGQILPISEYETLFQLIGTSYGGDGESSFALPDLRGRVPVHAGPSGSFSMAQSGGAETVTLTAAQYPGHSHSLRASSAAASSAAGPTGVLAATSAQMYGTGVQPSINMAANAISNSAGGAGFVPHENMAPFLAMNYIISLYGIFPSPT